MGGGKRGLEKNQGSTVQTGEKYPKAVWHLILDRAYVLPKLSLLYA